MNFHSNMTSEAIQDAISDIMSSGQGFGVSRWHREQMMELKEAIGQDRMREEVQFFYKYEDVENLKEGELEMMCEVVGAADVRTTIEFDYTD